MTPLPQASNPSNTNNPQKLSLSQPEPKLGWSAYAEQINGRFAMIGLVIVLLLEVFTHQSLLAWLGL